MCMIFFFFTHQGTLLRTYNPDTELGEGVQVEESFDFTEEWDG